VPTVLLPLLVVLIIAGIFKGLEDLERHKADNKANSTHTLVFDDSIKGTTYNHHHRKHYRKYIYYTFIIMIMIMIIIIFPSSSSSLPSSSLSSQIILSDFKSVMWSEIKVGEFIKVQSRETVPAGLIVADCVCSPLKIRQNYDAITYIKHTCIPTYIHIYLHTYIYITSYMFTSDIIH